MNLRGLAISLLCVLLMSTAADAHKKASYNLIIDTDAALDDLRMMHLFLASPEFNLNAVTCSDGVMAPMPAARKMAGMFKCYGHGGIPVGAGPQTHKDFTHRSIHEALVWPGGAADSSDILPAVDLLHESLQMHTSKNIIVVAGPMTNIAAVFDQYPEDFHAIERMIWYHDPDNPGTNYTRDSMAAKKVMAAFPHIEYVSGERLFLGKEFYKLLGSLNNKYTHTILKWHAQREVRNHKLLSRSPVWDDLLPIYLLYPEFFKKDGRHFTYNPVRDFQDLDIVMIGILDYNKPMPGVVFNAIPNAPNWLRSDLIPVVDTILERWGYNEYTIVAFTSEFHGHLGIYSIIGAKMGLRAMEYFKVGMDELKITSFAGTKPPLSCMHDGLQFSTGATLGYGTISVAADTALPKAVFDYKGRRIEMALKKKWRDRFAQDIAYAIDTYGLLSDAYWEHVRRQAISYWTKLDRFEIFNITAIEANN